MSTSTVNRVPAGVPAGGQFAAGSSAESPVALDAGHSTPSTSTGTVPDCAGELAVQVLCHSGAPVVIEAVRDFETARPGWALVRLDGRERVTVTDEYDTRGRPDPDGRYRLDGVTLRRETFSPEWRSWQEAGPPEEFRGWEMDSAWDRVRGWLQQQRNQPAPRDSGPVSAPPPDLGHVEGVVRWHDRHGNLHRDEGPAVVHPDGTSEWYRHGNRHRENGPALTRPDGAALWYRSGELHRDDGPAVTGPGGYEAWYSRGELHRPDGPAITRCDGSVEYYWYGTPLEHQPPASWSGPWVPDDSPPPF